MKNPNRLLDCVREGTPDEQLDCFKTLVRWSGIYPEQYQKAAKEAVRTLLSDIIPQFVKDPLPDKLTEMGEIIYGLGIWGYHHILNEEELFRDVSELILSVIESDEIELSSKAVAAAGWLIRREPTIINDTFWNAIRKTLNQENPYQIIAGLFALENISYVKEIIIPNDIIEQVCDFTKDPEQEIREETVTLILITVKTHPDVGTECLPYLEWMAKNEIIQTIAMKANEAIRIIKEEKL